MTTKRRIVSCRGREGREGEMTLDQPVIAYDV